MLCSVEMQIDDEVTISPSGGCMIHIKTQISFKSMGLGFVKSPHDTGVSRLADHLPHTPGDLAARENELSSD